MLATGGGASVGVASELPLDCTEIIRAAAVIGETFDLDVVAAVVDRPALACLDSLSAAVHQRVIEPVDGPEHYRFVDAHHQEVVDGIAASEKVRLHARVAEELGSRYADRIDAHLLELAGHWSAAAVGDHRRPAAGWVSRAASAAMVSGSYGEAARLYRRAVDIGTGALDDADLSGLQLGLAQASYRCGDVAAAVVAATDAATAGARAGRVDVIAESALVVEPSVVPGVNAQVRQLCETALAALPDVDRALRVRVCARLADVCHYLGDRAAARKAAQLLGDLADGCDDMRAVATALHAQQLAASAADSLTRREALADRLAQVADVLGDPLESAWAHLWQVDAALQRGEISRAGAELREALRFAERDENTVLRWELLRALATIAQAQARFDDAVALADEAEATMTAIGNPIGRFIWLGQRQNICHHTGLAPDFLDAAAAQATAGPHVDAPLIVTLAAADLLETLGDRKGAAAAYRSAGPAAHWQPAEHSDLFAWAYGVKVATALGELRDVEVIQSRLEERRGLHVASGAGCIAYLGPVELWLGVAAAALGDVDAAVRDLETALAACQENGAAGFHAQAQVELAEALVRRAAPGDALRARELAESAAGRAELLGMPPITAAARVLVERTLPSRAGGLTRREREVAVLVAKGLTNREIAQRLYLSERTAANHVQHILDKLDLSNRGQIAAWVSSEHLSDA